MSVLVVAVLAGTAACLLLPARIRAPITARPGRGTTPDLGWMLRWRWVLSGLAAAGAAVFLGGVAGAVAAPLAGIGCWVAIGRAEPAAVRRQREQLARDLPALVRLLGAALAAGAAPLQALEAVADAVPGDASARLASVVARLRLGAEPGEVWAELAQTPGLGPLGRTLARAHSSGAPVAVAVDRLADDLDRTARADVESRARAVGVKAAVPLGVCLLPCFLLLGIVPLVAGMLGALSW